MMMNLDPHMRMHVVAALQSEMRKRAEIDRMTRVRRERSPRQRGRRTRAIWQALRRMRPAVHQEVR
jgi:hypothetical protein